MAGKGRPYAACSRPHQPGAQTAEGPAAGEHVERRGRLGDDARRAEGGRGAERPELEVGAERRQRSERHPGLGDRVPRPSDLRDLDEVVHQGHARETRVRRREGDAAQPVERVLAPREPPDLEDHPRPGARRAPATGAAGAGLGGGSSADTTRTSQPSASSSAPTSRIRRSWPPSTAAGTGRSRAAFRARHSAGGVSNTTATSGSPDSSSQRRPRRPPRRVQAEGVDDHREAAPGASLDDLVEQPKRVLGRVEIGGAAAHHGAQRVRGDHLGVAVAGRGPGRLPGAGRADQQHQSRVGNLHIGSVTPG